MATLTREQIKAVTNAVAEEVAAKGVGRVPRSDKYVRKLEKLKSEHNRTSRRSASPRKRRAAAG